MLEGSLTYPHVARALVDDLPALSSQPESFTAVGGLHRGRGAIGGPDFPELPHRGGSWT
jgi:hypothetical protein